MFVPSKSANAYKSDDVWGTFIVQGIYDNDSAYTIATERISILKKQFDTVIDSINQNCSNVKDSTVITSAKEAIAKEIAELTDAVKKSYEEQTLLADVDSLFEGNADIETAITELLENAKELQKEYEKPNGINALSVDRQNVSGIFDLSGRPLKDFIKGRICIVVFKDGRTTKMLIK